jgi:hypothetical protein
LAATIAHHLLDEPTVVARLDLTLLDDERHRSIAELVRR